MERCKNCGRDLSDGHPYTITVYNGNSYCDDICYQIDEEEGE